jgi:hypothetical protein
MDSFYHSRIRILFEVLCALGLAASLAGAWIQLGATAFLPAAGIMALYGIVHGFDMIGRPPASAVAAMPVADEPADPSAHARAIEPVPVGIAEAVVATEPAESEPKPVKAPRKAKAKKPRPAKTAPAEPEPLAHEDRPIEQLFEPQPFVRQLRPAFGRRDRGPRPFAPTV